ncbi:MAG: Nramp family divalent metal transporter [Deltaproteobacteria bacterium]|nr:Nramp family divalent metal transporter [Deltaproteobacteria bacterium]
MGPGIITSSVDNDAGGIATYSLAGAEFGLEMIWIMVPTTLVLIIIQEMCARMAVVSGKGLSDLIRERYGVKLAFYTMVLLIFANLGTTLAEFAGIAAALEIFGISRYISVPLSILFLMWLVVKGTYGSVERVFLSACFFFVAYIVVGFLVKPDWIEVFHSFATPTLKKDPRYLVMMVGVVGTTISPWMLFYLQAFMVDKGLSMKDLTGSRLDVIVGSIVVSVVAFFIMLACAATLHKAGVVVQEAGEAALALEPVAGKYCKWLFAFGLFNASMFAASILPLSTAYTVCEAFGWESSLDKKFSEAPQFYGLYCFTIFLAGLLILPPGLPLVSIMFVSQVLNGLVLPVVLIFMILLVNDRAVMRDHTNGPVLNLVSWAAVVALIALDGVMLWSTITEAFSH